MKAVLPADPTHAGHPADTTGLRPVPEVGELPDPVARAGEVVVGVHAAGLNRADLMQLAGHYPPPRGESEGGAGVREPARPFPPSPGASAIALEKPEDE